MLVRFFPAVLLVGALLAGCGRVGEQQAEVSGKVSFKGKPLPGGVITFASARGYAATAVISPDGAYKLKAPIGDVQIGVDNRMLDKNDPKRIKAEQRGKSGRLKIPTEVASKQQGQQEVTGSYVFLPPRYSDPTKSGLTYKVTAGSQTHDVELSDAPSPASGAASP